jgi:XTP/dITP diphosphohydrolase
MSPSRLLFGTNNPHKLREIREIAGESYQVLSLADLDLVLEVAETEPTLEGNAGLKARAYFDASGGVPCFADDTGLEVEALHGAPGVYSARYAGEAATFEENVQKLLRELGEETHRRARFRTVIAFFDGKQMRHFEGVVEGHITRETRGEGGFGYDPIFEAEDSGRTFAEMTPAEKNKVSHRGRAVRLFAAFLMPQG